VRARAAGLALAAAGAALPCACAPGPSAPPGPDVVMVVVDTLRADHLPSYGYAKDTAPFLTELARTGTVFESAWSASSWTAPATASLFTGLLPAQHGVQMGYNLVLEEREELRGLELNRIPAVLETLPEFFRSRGYRTFGIADNPNVNPTEGFASGFDSFVNENYRTARWVNEVLGEWADAIRASPAAFVYLHYMDPHGPYFKRRPYFDLDDDELGIDPSVKPLKAVSAHDPDVPFVRRIDLVQILAGATEPAEVERRTELVQAYLDAAYDSEIRYVDEHVREAFELLGVDDETLVVFTSDHGEELFDHGQVGHEFTLYEELLHVPLVVRLPASRRPPVPVPRVTARVSTVDLFPTLRELVGAEPHPDHVGSSLVPLLTGSGTRATARPIVAMRLQELRDRPPVAKRSLVDGDLKLIVTTPGDELELFDLAADPDERTDLAAERAERAGALRERLERLDASLERWPREFVEVELDDAKLDVLDDLGYVHRGE